MAEILFIAPSSFPLNNPEAYVNAKVVKTLSEDGHILDVVSLKSKRRDRAYPKKEEKFYFKHVRSVNIIEINTGKNLSTVLNHLGCYLKTGFVYRGSDWAYKCIQFCKKLIKLHKYDFVYTYDYPSELVGLYLSKKYGLKWVATWNDPYTFTKYPAPYGEGSSGKLPQNREDLIREIGKATFKNIFPNNRLRDYMLQYMEGMKKESCVISPHIICGDLVKSYRPTGNKTLRLIHSGSIGRERDPKNLYKALGKLQSEIPDLNVELSFLGINDRGNPDYIANIIKENGIGSMVRFIPPVGYSESLEMLSEYDVGVIIEADLKEGIFLPSKVADYIQNAKPILALSPKIGVLDDLFKEGIIPYKGDIDDVESICKAIKTIINDFESGEVKFNDKSIEKYLEKEVLKVYDGFLSN